jgi:hypothetical protein
VSSRAAETARDLASALPLPRYITRIRWGARDLNGMTQFAVERSFIVCAIQDDMLTFHRESGGWRESPTAAKAIHCVHEIQGIALGLYVQLFRASDMREILEAIAQMREVPFHFLATLFASPFAFMFSVCGPDGHGRDAALCSVRERPSTVAFRRASCHSPLHMHPRTAQRAVPTMVE